MSFKSVSTLILSKSHVQNSIADVSCRKPDLLVQYIHRGAERTAHHIPSTPSSKWVPEDRIVNQIASAEVIKNEDFDDRSVVTGRRNFRVSGPCPLNCGASYDRISRSTPRHGGSLRLGLLVELLEALNADDEQTAMKILTQRDGAGGNTSASAAQVSYALKLLILTWRAKQSIIVVNHTSMGIESAIALFLGILLARSTVVLG